jgi:hypothetical protein
MVQRARKNGSRIARAAPTLPSPACGPLQAHGGETAPEGGRPARHNGEAGKDGGETPPLQAHGGETAPEAGVPPATSAKQEPLAGEARVGAARPGRQLT